MFVPEERGSDVRNYNSGKEKEEDGAEMALRRHGSREDSGITGFVQLEMLEKTPEEAVIINKRYKKTKLAHPLRIIWADNALAAKQ